MTNREMVIELFAKKSDDEFEKFYTDFVTNKPYESICDYCLKKNSGWCKAEHYEGCAVDAKEWLDAEAVLKVE